MIPSDDLQQVPTGGNYKGIVKIAGQEKLTKIVVNDSADQSVPRIIFVDLPDLKLNCNTEPSIQVGHGDLCLIVTKLIKKGLLHDPNQAYYPNPLPTTSS